MSKGPNPADEPDDPDAVVLRVVPWQPKPPHLPAPAVPPEEAARQVLATLKASPRATPPKTTVMQIVDYYAKRHQPLPSIVVKALAAAMAISKTTDAQDKAELVLAGGDAGLGDRHKRRIRKRGLEREWASPEGAADAARKLMASGLPIARKDRVALHGVVRWFSARGLPLPDEVRRAVAAALGLFDERGAWRQQVVMQATGGLREPARYRAVVEAEAKRLVNMVTSTTIGTARMMSGEYFEGLRQAAQNGLDVGHPADPGALAASIESRLLTDAMRERAEELQTTAGIKAFTMEGGIDVRTARDWVARPDWRNSVGLSAVAKLQALRKEAIEIAAREPRITTRHLAERLGMEAGIVKLWRTPVSWQRLVREARSRQAMQGA